MVYLNSEGCLYYEYIRMCVNGVCLLLIGNNMSITLLGTCTRHLLIKTFLQISCFKNIALCQKGNPVLGSNLCSNVPSLCYPALTVYIRFDRQLLYRVRRNVLKSQSQLCPRPPSSFAYGNNVDNS